MSLFSKKLIGVSLTTLALLTSTPSFGDNGSSGVDYLIGGYGSQQTKKLTDPPAYGFSKYLGLAQNAYLTPIGFPSRITIDTQGALAQLINDPNNDDLSEKIFNVGIVFSSNPAEISVIQAPCAITGIAPLKSLCEKQITEQYKKADINSLLVPLTYTEKESQAAKDFINNSVGLNNPLVVANIAKTATLDKKNIKDIKVISELTKDNKDYLAQLSAYTTIQSTVLSNLYYLQAEREPMKTVPPQALEAITKLGYTLAKLPSPLELEHAMATRRITDTNWYTSLTDDSPASLQRQMLMLLAENLAEAHQTRMTLERLLATQSMLLLQQSAMMRVELEAKAKTVGSNNSKQ